MEPTRAAKTNSTQWAVLVDFLLHHPEMVTRAFVGLNARQNYRLLWDQVAAQLNAMGFGSKTTDKWIDAFTKWKSKVKVKAQNIKLGMNRTGGGGPLPPLTRIEEKLMTIIGWTIVEGDATSELGLENKGSVPAQNSGNTAEPAQVLEGNSMIDFEINLPELVPLKNKKPTATATATASTSIISEKTSNIITHSGTADQVVAGIENKRKLIGDTAKCKYKKKKIVNQSKSGDEMTLLRMHQETMGVLKDINQNLGRLADGQEAFLNRRHFCQGCLAKKTEFSDNFHDYCKK